jgi:hypothetical protein
MNRTARSRQPQDDTCDKGIHLQTYANRRPADHLPSGGRSSRSAGASPGSARWALPTPPVMTWPDRMFGCEVGVSGNVPTNLGGGTSIACGLASQMGDARTRWTLASTSRCAPWSSPSPTRGFGGSPAGHWKPTVLEHSADEIEPGPYEVAGVMVTVPTDCAEHDIFLARDPSPPGQRSSVAGLMYQRTDMPSRG